MKLTREPFDYKIPQLIAFPLPLPVLEIPENQINFLHRVTSSIKSPLIDYIRRSCFSAAVA